MVRINGLVIIGKVVTMARMAMDDAGECMAHRPMLIHMRNGGNIKRISKAMSMRIAVAEHGKNGIDGTKNRMHKHMDGSNKHMDRHSRNSIHGNNGAMAGNPIM